MIVQVHGAKFEVQTAHKHTLYLTSTFEALRVYTPSQFYPFTNQDDSAISREIKVDTEALLRGTVDLKTST